MSGLEEITSGNKTYLNIIGGRVAQRVKEHIIGNDGKRKTEERKITDDEGNVLRTVIERYYRGIGGVVQSVRVDTSGDYGATIVIDIMAKENLYVFTVQLDSSYGKSIMFKVPNIDFSKEVIFRPYNFESKDEVGKNGKPKKIVGISIVQKDDNGKEQKIEGFWTKEDPKDLPPLEKHEGVSGVKWNGDKRLDFLASQLIIHTESLKTLNMDKPSEIEETEAPVKTPMTEKLKEKLDMKEETSDDDLPF